MFKKLEASWNARTPVWLHNGTKENIIAQLAATVALLVFLQVKDRIEFQREQKRLHADDPQND